MSKAASIRARLLNIAKGQGLNFNLITIRYFQERFLYRLSISAYKTNFYLKGGSFIYAIQGIRTRPTKDIDLLGKDITSDLNSLKRAITTIIETDYSDDGVVFNSETIEAIPIAEKNLYNGVRVTLDAELDTIRQKMQIDIGFGDVIIPKALDLNYPVLLNELLVPLISAYTIETIIAEKFQAMITLSTLNSRMKDFYDVFIFLTEESIDHYTLKNAILETFKNRETELTDEHALFTEEFWMERERIIMWKAFLKKINQESTGSFQNIMKTITQSLLPIVREIKAEKN